MMIVIKTPEKQIVEMLKAVKEQNNASVEKLDSANSNISPGIKEQSDKLTEEQKKDNPNRSLV